MTDLFRKNLSSVEKNGHTKSDLIMELVEIQVKQMIACIQHDEKHGTNTQELQVSVGAPIAMLLHLPYHMGDYINQSIRSAYLDRNKGSVKEIMEDVFVNLELNGINTGGVDFSAIV